MSIAHSCIAQYALYQINDLLKIVDIGAINSSQLTMAGDILIKLRSDALR
jgi:hypothetical protein